MSRARANLIFLSGLFSLLPALLIAQPKDFKPTGDAPPPFKEIPYFLRKLEKTQLEGERLEYNKKIHDALVESDLTNKKVIRQIEPIVDQILQAMDKGLDRPNPSGEHMWLNSAVNYFEQEKGRRLVAIPESEWMKDQLKSASGFAISTFRDKILIHKGIKTETLIEQTNIFEAVLSPTGKHVAFFRRPDEGSRRAQIWAIDLKKRRPKIIADLPSCYTVVFSLDGKRVYYQEEPSSPREESIIGWVSVKGGKKRAVGKAQLLQSVVEKGRYKGNLIVYKNVLHHLGFSKQACAYAVRLSGKEIGRLKDGPCR